MKSDLKKIGEALYRSIGENIFIYDESFLTKSVEKRLERNLIQSESEYADFLLTDLVEAKEFFRSLNITYSEFFRDTLTFAMLEKVIFPALFRKKDQIGKSEIRIWSCGCSIGQEAYSVAILLDDLAGRFATNLGFRIFATDIVESDLELARRAAYRRETLENVKFKHMTKYFSQKGEYYYVAPRLKEMVDFSFYNVLDELSSSPPSSVFGDFDVVLCGNLMIYYRDDVRHFILDKFHRSLAPDGFLIVGDAEAEILRQHDGYSGVAASCPVFRRIAWNGSKWK